MTMKKITAGRDVLGEFAPKFAQLNDDVLFGEVWSRESELSARDRSLITVTALMAQGLTDTSFGHHLAMAKENGITRSEIAEILTHAAFYAGWPKAWAAFRMAKDIWVDEESTDEKQLHQNFVMAEQPGVVLGQRYTPEALQMRILYARRKLPAGGKTKTESLRRYAR